MLHANGCAPRLYCTFLNGICYEFMQGDALGTQDVRDPTLLRCEFVTAMFEWVFWVYSKMVKILTSVLFCLIQQRLDTWRNAQDTQKKNCIMKKTDNSTRFWAETQHLEGMLYLVTQCFDCETVFPLWTSALCSGHYVFSCFNSTISRKSVTKICPCR